MNYKMQNKKTVYIIPGYEESHRRQPSYKKIAKIFQESGIKSIHIEINWHNKKPRRFSEYVQQFLMQYKKTKDTNIFVMGFSYGAVIAFLSEPKIKANGIILCSLSPYFKEDMKNLPEGWIRTWKKDFVDSDYSFSDIAKDIKTKTYILAGKQEPKACLTRARSALRKIKDSELILIKNVGHNINHKEYLEGIRDISYRL